MGDERVTLTQFVAGVRRRLPRADAGLAIVLDDIRLACKRIAGLVRQGALGAGGHAAGAMQGDARTVLAAVANELFLDSSGSAGHVAAMASYRLERPLVVAADPALARYLLVFDPLDGSSNVDVNVTAGSIFSVLRCPGDVAEPTERDFLQPGADQLCAGYAIYGPTTMLVLAMDQGAHGFTLDEEIEEFVLTHPQLRIPADTGELAIDAGNARFWEPAVKRYIDECLGGQSGPRGRDFNLRWIGSLVADVHRLLMRGGVCLHPRDIRNPAQPGRLRLLPEANPAAYIVERAGGIATTGRARVLQIRPESLEQRTSLILGSPREVGLIERYHAESPEPRYDAPLFGLRGLFRIGEARDGENRP